MIEWEVSTSDPKQLRDFLVSKNISRRIIGRTKFHGGSFLRNGQKVHTREMLEVGDCIHLVLPVEEPNPYLYTSNVPLDILYEDEDYLIVNKPVGVISVPSPAHRGETMAARVKGYLMRQDYRHRQVHPVTRLDRYTSGVMLFAKHALAHSAMDRLLSARTLEREYTLIATGELQDIAGRIDLAIGRDPHSIIKRELDPQGKTATTLFKRLEKINGATLVRARLITGRTHQIRVHFAGIGHALLGDDLYGAPSELMSRQALHCSKITFEHPFTKEKIAIEAPLPADMVECMAELRKGGGHTGTETIN